MREKPLQQKILNLLKNYGAYSVKQIVANKAGVPDIIFCLNGQFGAIEVKGSTGKPTKLQLYNIKRIKQSGGKAIWTNNYKHAKDFICKNFLN